MKISPLILLLFSGLLVGCNTFHAHIEEIEEDGTYRITDIKIYNAFDSKSDLSKLKTTFTDKTQGISVGSYSQESSATNLIPIVEAITKGVTKALVPTPIP